MRAGTSTLFEFTWCLFTIIFKRFNVYIAEDRLNPTPNKYVDVEFAMMFKLLSINIHNLERFQ